MRDSYWEMHGSWARDAADEPLDGSLRAAIGAVAFRDFTASEKATGEATERATRDAVGSTDFWAIQDLEAFVREGCR